MSCQSPGRRMRGGEQLAAVEPLHRECRDQTSLIYNLLTFRPPGGHDFASSGTDCRAKEARVRSR